MRILWVFDLNTHIKIANEFIDAHGGNRGDVAATAAGDMTRYQTVQVTSVAKCDGFALIAAPPHIRNEIDLRVLLAAVQIADLIICPKYIYFDILCAASALSAARAKCGCGAPYDHDIVTSTGVPPAVILGDCSYAEEVMSLIHRVIDKFDGRGETRPLPPIACVTAKIATDITDKVLITYTRLPTAIGRLTITY